MKVDLPARAHAQGCGRADGGRPCSGQPYAGAALLSAGAGCRCRSDGGQRPAGRAVGILRAQVCPRGQRAGRIGKDAPQIGRAGMRF